MTKEERLLLIHQIYSPSAPVEVIDLFAGRKKELLNIRKTVQEKGQHAVVFGRRGAGKTSLINVLNQIFTNVFVVKVTASRNDTFEDLWDRAVRKVKYPEKVQKIGFKSEFAEELVSLYLPDKRDILPGDIAEMFADVEQPLLFTFDEFDCVENKTAKIKMADTLKTLSDNAPNVTVLISGIAENVNQLVGFHPSLERCIRQVELALMQASEVELFLKMCMQITEMHIRKEVLRQITEYSAGFPHYVHLLAKFSAQEAAANGATMILQPHFNRAVTLSIENSSHSLRSAYKLAVKSSKAKNSYENVLFTIGNTPPDDGESYSPDFLLEHYNRAYNANSKSIKYNLGMLCRKDRGEILEKSGRSETLRYRLKNPLMRAFIKLKIHTEGGETYIIAKTKNANK